MNEPLKSRALDAMPGGVNSPVRAFASVGGEPLFAVRGDGPYLYTADGHQLIDCCMSFGPLILGHAHPEVVDAVVSAASRGTSYAVTTEPEIDLAERIKKAIPSMEKIRLVSSGTEACMTAIRIARGVTGRSKILKFSGCYHGHADCLLVQSGSGVAGIASASSAGVTEACASQMLVARYNHIEDLDLVIERAGDDLAAVIVEPVAANMGVILPRDGFLEEVVKRVRHKGALIIFDEVITGFRLGFGGYQDICGISPDLTTLGKIIGGGMPIGAIGGKAEWMEHLAPQGAVYQAGTLSGNPISVAAGRATLKWLEKNDPYPILEERSRRLTEAIISAASASGHALQMPRAGSLFGLFFKTTPVIDFDEVMTANQEKFRRLFHSLLSRQVYLAPSPYEAGFLSIAHTDALVERLIEAFSGALSEL